MSSPQTPLASPTIPLGVVDDYEGERVETDFRTIMGVIPFTPETSYYRRNEDQRYPIALNTKSVVKAVLSYHGLYLTLAIFALAVLNLRDPIGELFLFASVLSGLVSAFARFRLGALTPAEKRQRAIHLELTGVSALPHMLPPELVKTLRDALERKWKKRAGRASWREALDTGASDSADLKLLTVLAALEAGVEPEPEAVTRAQAAWKAFESCSDQLPLESLSPEEALQVLRSEPLPSQPKRAEARTLAKRETKRKRHKTSRGIKIRCERCEHVTRVPHTCAGQTGRCPSCERGVRVPSHESMRLHRAA